MAILTRIKILQLEIVNIKMHPRGGGGELLKPLIDPVRHNFKHRCRAFGPF